MACSQAKTPCLTCLISSLILNITLPPTGMPSPYPRAQLGQQIHNEGRLAASLQRTSPKLFSSYPHPLQGVKAPSLPNPGNLSPPRTLHRPPCRGTRFLVGQSFPSKICSFSSRQKKPVPPPVWSSVDQRRRKNSQGFIFKIEGKKGSAYRCS